MKKISILILTIVLSMTMCFVPSVTAFAAGSPVTVTAGTLDYSDEAQTVTVTIAVNPGVEITAYGGNVVLPEGWSVNGSVKVKGTDKDGDAVTSKQDPAADNNYSFNQIATMTATSVEITYNVPASASGEFTLGATNLILSKDGMNQLEGDNNGITATTNVIITKPEAPVDGYTVALSTDVSNDGVKKGGTFNVKLDVRHSDSTVNTFNAFYAKLTYDSKVTYSGDAEVTMGEETYSVDSTTAGTLKISKLGEDVTISKDASELVLPFTAAEKGDSELVLSQAKVDVGANAEEDAPGAAISGSPCTVKVIETAATLVAETEYVGTGEASTCKLIAVTINDDESVPTYNGKPMYKVAAGDNNFYKNDRYYMVLNSDEEYNVSLLGSVSGAADTIAVDYDVNMTELVDINDAQFVYNVYQKSVVPSKEYVVEMIRADADRSGAINTSDCAAVVQNIQ